MQAARRSSLPQAGWQAAAGSQFVLRLVMACRSKGFLQGLAAAAARDHLHHLQATKWNSSAQVWCSRDNEQAWQAGSAIVTVHSV